MSQNKFFFFFFVLSLIIALVFLFYKPKNSMNPLDRNTTVRHVVINAKTIKVLVADNYAEHVLGLSDRSTLEPDSGMLFIFQEKRIRKIWMKNMHFPIDIIWIENEKVVQVTRNCKPNGATPSKMYSSTLPVDNILEVNAGFSNEFGIKRGDLVKFKY